ncbi:GNAT family N-acetyltransferase [Pelomonas sp. CA6]|uniref:GNAT family N-acetyltransferase n=1 Tax=Pelomonas sp. CA6 TaxID=2907999 RepID=UPI001F4C44C6|nr:GNAT family N-acetyltransferase [Pelomonas sp. CA6]MCH7343511.1 GNAT family N-acetyltransferase [Pelomonas sp. CA6]
MDILETSRLRLRWFDPERDAAFALELLNDPDWITHIYDLQVRERVQAREWIQERLLPRYWSQGHGFWLVERRSDGEPLGLCGIIHREGLDHPDLGYGFLGRHRGQGYAREAARACLDYARRVLALDFLLATTAVDNEASGRLLLDLGFEDRGVQQTAAHEGLSRVYEWGQVLPPVDDDTAIRTLLARFWSAFDNREGIAPLAMLPRLFSADARIHRADAQGVQSMGVAQFLLPRAALLMPGGALTGFHETMTELRLDRQGRVAQAWMRYIWSGRRDGQPRHGGGTKTAQLLRTDAGWRIASLAWQDEG